MNKILLGLLLLAPAAGATDLKPARVLYQVVSGGSDPTKLPLAGGTMTGPIFMSTGMPIVFSTADAPGSFPQATIRYTGSGNGMLLVDSTGTIRLVAGSTAPIQICGDGGNICVDVSSIGVRVTSGTVQLEGQSPDGVALKSIHNGAAAGFGSIWAQIQTGTPTGFLGFVASTSTDLANDSVITLLFDTGSGDLFLGGNGGYGEFSLSADGTANVSAGGTAPVSLNGDHIHFSNPPASSGHALCVNASGNISGCTSVVGAGGTCTCP